MQHANVTRSFNISMIMNPYSHIYNSPQTTFHFSRKARRLKGHGLRLRVDCPYPDTGHTIRQHVPYEPRRPLLQRQKGIIWNCHACQEQIDNPFFTVGCENCNEWYHLKCVAISKDPAVVSQDCGCLQSTCNSFKKQMNLQSYIEKRGDKSSSRQASGSSSICSIGMHKELNKLK